MPIDTSGLLPVRQLSPNVLEDVRRLAAECNQYEQLDLPLNLQPATDEDKINQFLYVQDGMLAGFWSIFHSRNPEMCGMVHPSHRRRGVGRALYDAAVAECRQHASSALLICETGSQSGQAFVAALGLARSFAEHRMVLQTFRPPASQPPELRIKHAVPEDTEALAAVTAAAFDDPLDRTLHFIAAAIKKPDQRYYLAHWEDSPVAVLRAELLDEQTFIYGFGVHPDWRGRGIGRQVLSRAIEILQAEGRTEIGLEVETDNTPAIALYRACGFTPVRTYEYFDVDL